MLRLTLVIPLILFAKLPLFYWGEQPNFGDVISKVIIERMVGEPLECYKKKSQGQKKKLLAIGSILYFANDGDVVWGSGVHGKTFHKKYYDFKSLDVRSVRGPVTRKFLMDNFEIACPEIYGDPALLFPYLFPEFKKKENPSIDYLIIPHYSDREYFPKSEYPNVVYPTDPWEIVMEKILDSKFVIASSLHPIIIAESYQIPARALRITDNRHNPMIKFYDYYLGTNRPYFQFAATIEQALRMGGEPPMECDLEKLYNAFPWDFWRESPRNSLRFKE